MFTAEDYLYGWLLYIGAGLVFTACWWYATRKIGVLEIRALLRSIAVTIMFVPWYANPDLDYLAPAVVIAGVEGIFDGEFWRAGTPLLVALTAAIILTLVYTTMRRLARRDEAEAEADAQF